MARIRRATEADLGRIVELWDQMWRFQAMRDPRFEASPAAAAVVHSWVAGDLADDRIAVFVSEEAGGVIGFARAYVMEIPPVVIETTFGYLSDLVVDEAARGRGIGAALVGACHEWLRAMGVRHVEVNVSVRNPEAREFYEGRGYVPFVDRLRAEL
jgi:GNAT superfamily N-acetyltransferase